MQTCKYLYDITNNKALWIRLLYSQYALLPLPFTIQKLVQSRSIANLDQASIRDTVISASLTSRGWLRQRSTLWKDIQRLSTSSTSSFEVSPDAGEPRSVCTLQIFLDRWLVVSVSDGLQIWDLFPEAKMDPVGAGTSWLAPSDGPQLCRLVPWGPREMLTWCTSCLNPEQRAIFVATVTRYIISFCRLIVMLSSRGAAMQEIMIQFVCTSSISQTRTKIPSGPVRWISYIL